MPVQNPYSGFGSTTPGGFGQTVVRVTTLADSGPGSLREALSAGNRLIMFDVGGDIVLSSEIQALGSLITIAGQTAPAPGIRLLGHGIIFRGDLGANNIICRDIRVRDAAFDGFQFWREAYDCVLDHCDSFGAVDGNLDITDGCHDITVSYCIFGANGKNSLVKEFVDPANPVRRLSFHHTIFVNSNNRNPQINIDDAQTPATEVTADLRNCVFWGWGSGTGPVVQNGAWANIVQCFFGANGGDIVDSLTVTAPGRAYVALNESEDGFDVSSQNTESVPFAAELIDNEVDAHTAVQLALYDAGARPLDTTATAQLATIVHTVSPTVPVSVLDFLKQRPPLLVEVPPEFSFDDEAFDALAFDAESVIIFPQADVTPLRRRTDRVLPRLLKNIPTYLDRTPQAEPALLLTYDGTAKVTIWRRVLWIRVSGGTGSSFAVDLEGRTIENVAAILSAQDGYTTTVVGDGTALAIRFVEVMDQDVIVNPRLDCFRSLLWNMLVPVAWSVEDLIDLIEDGRAQMTLKTATDRWVDLWGEEYYGGVMRRLAEPDRTYADRIIREVTRWRLNNRALEVILQEDIDATATVTNLHDQAWVVAETAFGFLAWRKYSRTTFEVRVLESLGNAVREIIERNRAAGTLPFYALNDQVTLDNSITIGAINTILATAWVGQDNVWQIGKPIGEKPLSVFFDFMGKNSIVTRKTEAVFGLSGATPFVLGTATLDGSGGTVLGDPVNIPGLLQLTDNESAGIA